jgi:hypothetical protein
MIPFGAASMRACVSRWLCGAAQAVGMAAMHGNIFDFNNCSVSIPAMIALRSICNQYSLRVDVLFLPAVVHPRWVLACA